AQLLVVDELAGGLHRREQRRLGVTGRWLRHLVLELGGDAAHGLALLERGDLSALGLLLRLALLVRLEAVDTAPPGFERDLAARAEAFLLDDRDHGRARIAGRWMEDGEETLRDQI